MKNGVRKYVSLKLQELRENKGATATVKNINSEQDFGVWLDYQPQACKSMRRSYITKMGSLPLIATTLALHPKETRRGWILQELTMNTHGNIHDLDLNDVDLNYASRVNLMANKRVVFTNGSDGSALRCYELVQFGQYPRCWPSVNRTLLHEWRQAGVKDERDVNAKSILFQYARTFHYDCQVLKRYMVEFPQRLARMFIPEESDDPSDWVHVQAIPGQSNPDYTLGTTELQEPPSFRTDEASMDSSNLLSAISQQTEDMKFMGIDPLLSEASGTLQLRQFLAR
jgi:hypothetical protein